MMDSVPQTLLPESTAHIWRFPLVAARQEIKALMHWLGPLEQQVLTRLARQDEKDRRIVAWGRLRYILSRYMECAPEDIDIEREPSGRPRLAASCHLGLQFSLAHSGNSGLVGVDAHGIGVDIEKLRPTKPTDRIAARFFSNHEAASLVRRPVEEQTMWFFRHWVLKEAYLKSVGGRVPADLPKCEIVWTSSGPVLAHQEIVSQECARNLVEIPVSAGYVAALAVSANSTHIRVQDL